MNTVAPDAPPGPLELLAAVAAVGAAEAAGDRAALAQLRSELATMAIEGPIGDAVRRRLAALDAEDPALATLCELLPWC